MVLSDGPSGTIALALNQHMNITTGDIPELEDLDLGPRINHPIHWGGPSCPESIWLLHNEDWRSENTLAVGPGVRVSSDREMLIELVQGQGPDPFRLMAGFMGWSGGELAETLDRDWLVLPNPGLDWILEQPVDDLWNTVTKLCVRATVDLWL